MQDQYTVLPRFYDKLNGEADYVSYVDYLARHISCHSSVLDLGCGTGNVSTELALRGYDVTGLDVSSEMLTEARYKSEKQGANVFYTCQDMTSFSTPVLYDAVVSSFDCLNYLLSKEKLFSAFCRVNNALCDNGVFLFDMNSPYKFENVYADNTFVIEEDDIFCVWENEFNKKTGKCNFYINIFALEGEKYTRWQETQSEKSYSLKTILKLLNDAGFSSVEVFSDFDGGKVVDTTERYYFIARK